MEFNLFPFSAWTELEMLGRILFAALIGGLIGVERRHAGRSAGIRTLALVSLGAAAFTVVSIYGFASEENQFRDLARVAAQVATGVGFIGAGTIFRSGDAVRGLTTATALWVAAALGVATGAGMYAFAAGGAVITISVLYFLPRRTDGTVESDVPPGL